MVYVVIIFHLTSIRIYPMWWERLKIDCPLYPKPLLGLCLEGILCILY